jgi:hypothetical protein
MGIKWEIVTSVRPTVPRIGADEPRTNPTDCDVEADQADEAVAPTVSKGALTADLF